VAAEKKRWSQKKKKKRGLKERAAYKQEPGEGDEAGPLNLVLLSLNIQEPDGICQERREILDLDLV